MALGPDNKVVRMLLRRIDTAARRGVRLDAIYLDPAVLHGLGAAYHRGFMLMDVKIGIAELVL